MAASNSNTHKSDMSMSSKSSSSSSSSSTTTCGNYSKWLAVVFGLGIVSLVVTSSYNRLLLRSATEGGMMAPQRLHQQSHATTTTTGSQPQHQSHVNSSIVLLLSFPNSGTSYTLANTQAISNMTVATSYDQEIVYDGPEKFVGAHEQSPYILNTSLQRPLNILTKTHCSGLCEVCVPEVDVQAFDAECLSLTKYNAATKRNTRIPYTTTSSSTTPLTKAVHLVRNPHDNLVARMHMGVERRRERLGWSETDLAKFSKDEAGFTEWCAYIDSLIKTTNNTMKATLREQYNFDDDLLDELPCLSEWWRYVQWHNNAIAMLKARDIPALVLYYEEYTDNYQQAVDDLFSFLELPQVLAPVPFITGKTYESYFSAPAKRLAAQFVQRVASPLCWDILKGYFESPSQRDSDRSHEKRPASAPTKERSSTADDDDDEIPTINVPDADLPVVALLISFPNSGTSYTLKNTMISSNLSVGTNYEQEVKELQIPVRPDLARSPYKLKPAFELPHYILTKTHCAGYCEQCEPAELDDFEYHCLVRTRTIGPGKSYERLPYARDLVKKTIHLFRDPFDNLIARMHLGIDRRRVVLHWSDEELSVFTNTPQGMKAWCKEVDSMFRGGDFSKVMRKSGVPSELYAHLPCKTDWYRFVMWHNRAIELIERWNVPNHVVYYEDYTRRYNETVAGILEYLDLKAVHANYPFYSGKTYRSLYDDETVRQAAAFAERVASPECWRLIRHYFSHDPRADSGPKVALLLSYPNSGTSYTILNTEQMTNATTATNHGQEVQERIPLRPEISDAPFIHRPGMDLPALVLTKTHCTGYNFQDIPATSLDTFKEKCLTATWSDGGKGLGKAAYSDSLVDRAVHLIRSPWDNMVSRMHHGIKNAAKLKLSDSFIATITSDDPKGNLRAWCQYVDSLWPSTVRAALKEGNSRLANLPCHTDLLRYTWWHNWALEMTDTMALPVHILHYEEYSTGYNQTVNGLYRFLDQPIRRTPLAFDEGKSYLDHFDSKYLEVASEVINTLASDMTLSLVSRYLVNGSVDKVPAVPRQSRKLAWLLSFPNSGTSYTITNVQRISNTSAASNYLSETQKGALLTVRPDLVDGPYLLKEDRPVPRLVLTKTHCAGYCDGCASHAFVNTVESFERGCREAHGRDRTDRKQYSETPDRAVHLFRDVLDNLVARKHLGMELRVANDESLAQSKMNEDSSEGFLAWCSYIDQVSAKDGDLSTFLQPEQLALSRGVPCAFELYRYVSWHNHALAMTDRLDMPVHYIYYEDYSADLNETIRGLVDFLDIRIVGPPIEFKKGKSYGDIISVDHAQAVSRFVRSLASDKCWGHISRYFDRWIGDEVPELDRKSREATALPKIALLLSFPNSGTSFTLENTMAVTRSAVATNYANEVNHTITVRPDLDHSPFLVDPELEVHGVVLTKTHCNPKDDYILFRDGCRTLRTTARNETINQLYPMSLVENAVHLIRDPMDNIVSRMHHGLSNRVDIDFFDPSLRNVTDPRALFRPWCTYIDRKYWVFGQKKSWITQAASDLFNQVPCYTDVLHFVVWHNLALQMLDEEKIPTYHLYYEDYTSDFRRSILRLYTEFLHLPMDGQPAEFVTGKSYRDYFTDAEALALAKLVREVASPRSWSLLRHYFADWQDILEGTKIAPAAWPGQNADVKVAWLLSFPNSGTTFTLANTEMLTNSSTAANYAQGHDTCVPVRPDLNNGPFIHDLNLALPRGAVLTKTHCAGYCDDCNLSRSFLTTESFEHGCGSGQKRVGHKFAPAYYPSTIPDRIVHLVRDPIDNIVSRMHHGVMRRREFLGWTDEQLSAYSHSKDGVHRWCSLIDNNFWDKAGVQAGWVDDATRELMTEVPCAADFFRAIQWHNHALEMTEKLGLPSHLLYYEDYALDFDKTSDELFKFLDVPRTSQASNFIPGKTYRDFFEVQEVEAIARLVRAIAIEKSWNVLRRYFLDDLAQSNVQVRAQETAIEPKVAWLMSFPNSGTSYTITNLKEITQRATATNYLEGEAMKFKPLFPNQVEGPYVKEPFYELPEYVLTKTHCDGYCDLCNQETSRQTLDSFELGCASGTRWIDGEKEFVTYSSALPQKVVHLIRSPFDNIVARMHLGIGKRRKGGWTESSLANFNDTTAGVLAWCRHVDDRFKENPKRPLFTEEQKLLVKQLPCHSEWYRFVSWHNFAIQLIQRLELPALTMFYESYTTDFNNTVQNLLGFLELTAVRDSKKFIAGKTYHNLFLTEHIQIASKVVRMFAIEECWELLRHYFDDRLGKEDTVS